MRVFYICKRLIGFSAISVFFLFLSCGGGGGGGDGGGSTTTADSPTALSYTGSTSKATIDDANAVVITSSAVNGGLHGAAVNGVASMTSISDTVEAKNNNSLIAAMAMKNAVVNLQAASDTASASSKTVQTEQDTIDGACGGQAVGNMQVDDVAGNFSGSLDFSNYCESQVILNGNANFSGSVNTTTEQFESIKLDFNYLKANYGSTSYIFDGTISINIQATDATMTMNMYIQDSNSGDVFWIDGYRMGISADDSYYAITISGNFYDPHYGYVTVSTQQNLLVSESDMIPYSGILIAVGENGTAGGPTKARLTCYSSGSFQVEADTNGDGVYDWDSGDLSWSNI
jgi:hypothetical protein